MKKKLNIQKRSFLLIEILLSLALVALCVIPLLKPHFQIRRIENNGLLLMDFEKHSRSVFLEFKRKLYEREISWQALMNEEANFISVYKKGQVAYNCPCSVCVLDHCRKETKEEIAILELMVQPDVFLKNGSTHSYVFSVEMRDL